MKPKSFEVEKVLTKYFWVLNLVTLALVALFLASGTSQFLASKVSGYLPTVSSDGNKVSRSPRLTRKSRITTPDGTDILERNIFDSTMGPLDDDSLGPEEEEVPETVSGDLPIVPCTGGGVKLFATVASRESQAWSFASIAEGGQNKLCRVGDQIDNRTVSGITWRYLFLRGSSDECYYDLFGDPKAVAKAPKRATVAATSTKENLKEGIQDISETEKVVDRALVDKLLSDPTRFVRSVRVRPHRQNGEVVGFKLRRFRPDSPIALLGAKKGDIIHSVNGKKLTSVDQALGAYQGLRSSDALSFSITRNGKPMDINVKIK